MNRRKTKAKTKKKPHRKKKLSKAFMVWYGCAALIFVSVMAVVSMELAFLAIGFVTLSIFVLFEHRRRKFWEQGTSFKILMTGENHDKLVREIARNRNDISSLKKNMTDTAIKLIKQEKKLSETMHPHNQNIVQSMRDEGEKPRSSAGDEPGNTMREDLEIMPRAYKPQGQKPEKIRRRIANDGLKNQTPVLSNMVMQELINHAVRKERIDVFVQPIVRLPQRQVRFYEMFARIRAKAGVYLPASQYLKLARKNEVMDNIDHLLLTECLKIVQKNAHISQATPFILNITNATLKSSDYMKKLLAFLSRNRNLASRLVFEIQQQTYKNLQPALREILQGLGKLGCSFSLDHVTELSFDIPRLHEDKVRYIKIDSHILQNKAHSEKAFVEFCRLKRKLEGNGIAVIAEKLETETQMRHLLDYDLNYGQGYLFGKPDLQGAYQQRKAA